MKSVSPRASSNGYGKRNGHRKAIDKDVISQTAQTGPKDGGNLIVLTAPRTDAIDHAGFFIQIAMASVPIRRAKPSNAIARGRICWWPTAGCPWYLRGAISATTRSA